MTRPKYTIDELDMFDLPMLGVFDHSKEFTAYSLSVLAGIEVKNLDDMDVKVEDFMNLARGKRNMRMDVRVNLNEGKVRTNIEIQRVRSKDELMRVLYYLGGLLADFPVGLKKIPEIRCISIIICDFDPFKGTLYEGMTRMRYKLRSIDDSEAFHSIGDAPYPFEAMEVLIYNGNRKREKPKSREEEMVWAYLDDMKTPDPRNMTSSIAAKAVSEYKGDPAVMDKTKEWIDYNFKDIFDAVKKDYQKQMEIETQKHQKQMEIETQKHQRQMEIESQKHQRQMEIESQKHQKQMEIEAQKHQKQMEIEAQKHQRQMEMVVRELIVAGMTDIDKIATVTTLSPERVQAIASSVISK